MTRTLRILHLEDRDEDVRQVWDALRRAGWECDVLQAKSSAEFLSALHREDVDVVLSDSGVPGFDGVSALRLARQKRRTIPFIFVSGGQRSEQFEWFAAPELKNYVKKTNLDDLAPVIEEALRNPPQTPIGGPGKEVEGLKHLLSVVQELSLARDLATVMQLVRTTARNLVGADGATFVLREGDECFYADEDAISPLWKGSRFSIHSCISGWAMLQKKEAVIQDIYADPRVPAEAYRSTFVKSLVMVPIRSQDPLGAIGTYWAHPHRASAEEVALLQSLADSTSIAMENVRLHTELSRRLSQGEHQLETMNEGLSSFSYAISHDLGTQVGTILSSGQFLETSSSSSWDEAGKGHLKRIVNSARQMNNMITSLRDLAKVDLHVLDRTPLDLAEISRRLIGRLLTGNPDRKMELHIAPKLPAEADPLLMEIVLHNLISNAWKFTAGKEAPRIQVGERKGLNGEHLFYVSDNGVGFDPAYSSHLFGVFQRLNTGGMSNGIGLATVHRIIRKHGGRIWAEAALNRGATFYFTLA